MLHLGAAIRSERSGLGMSQDELARRSGLHRTYISDLERGIRNPSVESIEKLASALRLSMSVLFERAEDGSARMHQTIEILLVEDNPNDIELTIQAFQKAHIANPIRILRDGQKALDYFFAATPAGEGRPNWIILLDLNLPRVKGVDVLARLKADKRTHAVPVIILTASNHDRDFIACRQLGCDEYIVKPVRFENFSQTTAHFRLAWTLVTNGGEHVTSA